jgi:hypothetical protein
MGRLTRKIMFTVAAAVMLGSAGTSAALAASTTNTGSTTSTASTTNTASVTRSAPEAAASVPRCYPQDLSASLHGGYGAGGGRGGYILTLTNNGQRSCSLYGYPGLGLQDWNHHAVPSHTFWGSTWFDRDPGRQLIVLSPGETASASLAWTSGALRGPAVFAAYLVVTPPNDYGHLVVGPFSRSMEIPIYHGDLYVTAMARHTPHP